jgi:hypothetical protein
VLHELQYFKKVISEMYLFNTECILKVS